MLVASVEARAVDVCRCVSLPAATTAKRMALLVCINGCVCAWFTTMYVVFINEINIIYLHYNVIVIVHYYVQILTNSTSMCTIYY
jgi:hypothetical protein